MDRYRNFASLKQHESDFHIEIHNRRSEITILAPHGGKIEPHTSEIARLIAGNTYNCYCFNGTKTGNNRDLHITSHRFDEQQALALLQHSRTVITVHGCTEKDPVIFLGGLNAILRNAIAACLADNTIPYTQCPHSWPLSGTNPDNICNRGITGTGVQMEVSRPLRDSASTWKTIADSVRTALFHYGTTT